MGALGGLGAHRGHDGLQWATRALALWGKALWTVLKSWCTLAPSAHGPVGAIGLRMFPEPHRGCDSGALRAWTSPRTGPCVQVSGSGEQAGRQPAAVSGMTP